MTEYRQTRRVGILLVLAIVVVAGYLVLLPKNSSQSKKVTPSASLPVEQGELMTGEISSLRGSTFTMISDSVPGENKKEYSVITSKDTRINRPSIVVPYLTKKFIDGTLVNLTFSALQEGMTVKVQGVIDGDSITAHQVTLPRITSILQATLKKVENDSIIVEAVPVFDTLPKSINGQWPPPSAEYTIMITPDTELSKEVMDNPTGKSMVKEFQTTSLKVDQQLIIYSVSDVTASRTVTAARIEPII